MFVRSFVVSLFVRLGSLCVCLFGCSVVCLFVWLFVWLFVCLVVCLSVAWLVVCSFGWLFARLVVCLFVCSFGWLCVCLFARFLLVVVRLCVCLFVCLPSPHAAGASLTPLRMLSLYAQSNVNPTAVGAAGDSGGGSPLSRPAAAAAPPPPSPRSKWIFHASHVEPPVISPDADGAADAPTSAPGLGLGERAAPSAPPSAAAAEGGAHVAAEGGAQLAKGGDAVNGGNGLVLVGADKWTACAAVNRFYFAPVSSPRRRRVAAASGLRRGGAASFGSFGGYSRGTVGRSSRGGLLAGAHATAQPANGRVFHA